MGRNAKLYKSAHKGKKKQSSSTQEQISNPINSEFNSKKIAAGKQRSNDELKSNLAQSMPDKNNSLLGEAKKKRSGSVSDSVEASRETGSNGKLKSKLWRNLEAKRAKEGKGEFATPKEAGIDYLSQWEKRGR